MLNSLSVCLEGKTWASQLFTKVPIIGASQDIGISWAALKLLLPGSYSREMPMQLVWGLTSGLKFLSSPRLEGSQSWKQMPGQFHLSSILLSPIKDRQHFCIIRALETAIAFYWII